MGLTILLTNICMDWPSGTVVYTRDLALELKRMGHRPIVYTWLMGRASDDLEAEGVEVADSLWRIHDRPDIIHGNHRPLVQGALLRFPDVPAIAFCHNHSDPWSVPAPNPRIRRYFGVSELCVERLRSAGAPAAATGLQLNFVDLRRFECGPQLPAQPGSALIFSNYATPDTHLPAITEACRRLSLNLDVIGRGVRRASDRPERVLAHYDLVFAKAKAAMEAMAVGRAVILCDFGGLGPMVTSEEFARLRPLNFGFQALAEPLTWDGVLRQIERYDAEDAGRVRDMVRAECGLELATHKLVGVYEEVIAEYARIPAIEPSRRRIVRGLSIARYRASAALMAWYYRRYGIGQRRVHGPLRPLYVLARTFMRRLLWVR